MNPEEVNTGPGTQIDPTGQATTIVTSEQPSPNSLQSEVTTADELEAVHHYAKRSRQQLISLIVVFLVIAIVLIGVTVALKTSKPLIFAGILFLISVRLLFVRKKIPSDSVFTAATTSLPATQTVTGVWSYYNGYGDMLPEFKGIKGKPGNTGLQIGTIIIRATNTKWSMYQWMSMLNQYKGSQLTVQYSTIYPNVPLRILTASNLIYDILGSN